MDEPKQERVATLGKESARDAGTADRAVETSQQDADGNVNGREKYHCCIYHARLGAMNKAEWEMGDGEKRASFMDVI